MKVVLLPIQSKLKLRSLTKTQRSLGLTITPCVFLCAFVGKFIMKDITIHLQHSPGELAEMGETLGAAGISLEGGGVFVHNGKGIAHFLVEDPEKAQQALETKGIEVAAIHPVLIQKLRQDVPGQLGKICRLMEKNNINILVQYSDHNNQLILVVDDHAKGKIISDSWANGIYE